MTARLSRGISDRVSVALMGGLGNQLYQLATGLEVAARASCRLTLDLSWYRQALRRSDGVILRHFELGPLTADLEIYRGPSSSLASVARHSADILTRRQPWLAHLPWSRRVVEAAGSFDERILAAAPGSLLVGYFASWRYFPQAAHDVRTRVEQAVAGSEWLEDLRMKAKEQQPIALHVRRGDYLTLSGIYGHISPDYYFRAVRLIRGLGHGGPVWLFSDDPGGAREWLSSKVQVDELIQPGLNVSSLEVMSGMSYSSAVVAANSSFSWWGAFLRDEKERPVVAPRPVFASASMGEPRDSYLPNWLTLDCRACL